MDFERVRENRDLIWTGEHWIAYLRNHQDQADVARVSLYRVTYSSAGEGHVAFVDIPEAGVTGIYADSQPLARFMVKAIARGSSNNNLLKSDMEFFDGGFAREGDIRSFPTWRITTDAGEIKVVWENIHSPLILEGTGPVTRGTAVTHSLLLFANGAIISFNGKTIPGVVYVREDWIRAIGRQGTSAVFALSETTMRVPGG